MSTCPHLPASDADANARDQERLGSSTPLAVAVSVDVEEAGGSKLVPAAVKSFLATTKGELAGNGIPLVPVSPATEMWLREQQNEGGRISYRRGDSSFRVSAHCTVLRSDFVRAVDSNVRCFLGVCACDVNHFVTRYEVTVPRSVVTQQSPTFISSLRSLYATAAHLFTFAVALRFLVHASPFSVSAPLLVFLMLPQIYPRTSISIPYLPPP